jgi:hypothetical protein
LDKKKVQKKDLKIAKLTKSKLIVKSIKDKMVVKPIRGKAVVKPKIKLKRKLKRKLVIYSINNKLKNSIVFKRKNLILTRQFYLEQLVDVANKQQFSSSKFKFFRKKLTQLSRNRQFRYKKLKRRARRRYIKKPLPFGSQKQFMQSNELREYIRDA